MISLYQSADHQNVAYTNLTSGSMVQANQHLICHGNESMLLDPGGHKVYTRLFGELASIVPINTIKYLFFSHQDPDIVAAANGWLMVTDAKAYLSRLWLRFIPHFGVDDLVAQRIIAIPDEGMVVKLGGVELKLIAAHFLHSAGNFQVYDPVAKILYSGDLGASLGASYDFVTDFQAHISTMEGFHQRYIPSNRALRLWVNTVRELDIDTIAPQHGAMIQGKEMVAKFLDWLEGLECGLDLMGESFPIPGM